MKHWTSEALDRLADGELSPEETQDLLRCLDEIPDGWRRCALAFLEAQAWKREFATLVPASPGDPEADTQAVHASGGSRSEPKWHLLLAMAATFLLAFGLGQIRLKQPSNEPSPSDLASDGGSGNSSFQSDSRVTPVGTQDLTHQPTSEVEPLGNVVMVVDEDKPSARQIDVPIYSWDAQQAIARSSALSPEVINQLEAMGHEVRRSQRFVPVQLRDGRRAIVPVEEVEIVPIRGRGFQ